MKRKLLIIGAGGHGKVIADIALKMCKWEIIEFLDDNQNLTNSLGLRIIGKTTEFIDYIDEYDFFVAIGDNKIRKEKQERLEKAGASIPKLIHPSAQIAEEVSIGYGTAVMAGVIINSSTNIGKGCIINTGSTIDHDNHIHDFVHVSPGSNLAGNVEVGEECWLGIGCTLINNIKITKGSIIGAGSVVVKHIHEKGVYIGIPAEKR